MILFQPAANSKTPFDTKIDTLTSLRFFAAVAIVAHHMVDFGLLSPSVNDWPLDNGVSFFFLLSGFVMFLVYGGMSDATARKAYFVARVARIYPLHLATFGLLILLLGFNPDQFGWSVAGWPVAMLNLLLLQAWVPIGSVFFSFNSVSWTISVEMFFYVAFIALVVDFPRRWPYALALGALLVIGFCLLGDWLDVAAETDVMHRLTTSGLVYINPLARLFEFILGMCIGLAWVTAARKVRLDKRAATILELAVLVVFSINIVLAKPITVWVWQFSPSFGAWLYHGGAVCLSTGLVILVFAFQAGAASALLRHRFLVFLGEISFSIYLVHQILLRSYGAHQDMFSGAPALVKIVLFTLVVLATSTLLFSFVEVPARNFLRRAYAKRVTDRAAAAVLTTTPKEVSPG